MIIIQVLLQAPYWTLFLSHHLKEADLVKPVSQKPDLVLATSVTATMFQVKAVG
jgi:hypothetical protein